MTPEENFLSSFKPSIETLKRHTDQKTRSGSWLIATPTGLPRVAYYVRRARTTEELAGSRVDLGAVMMETAEQFEGRGGGHNTVAGAFILERNEKSFLKMVNGLVGERRKT